MVYLHSGYSITVTRLPQTFFGANGECCHLTRPLNCGYVIPDLDKAAHLCILQHAQALWSVCGSC